MGVDAHQGPGFRHQERTGKPVIDLAALEDEAEEAEKRYRQYQEVGLII